MSILKDFFNGNTIPCEKYIKRDGEYYELNKELTKNIDNLSSSLNSQEKDLFEKIENDAISICAICEEERYIEGFCAGAKMMLEIMNYKSENFM